METTQEKGMIWRDYRFSCICVVICFICFVLAATNHQWGWAGFDAAMTFVNLWAVGVNYNREDDEEDD